jgi:hypothetical protein
VENALPGFDFSTTGRRLATPLADNTVVVWDLSSGTRIGEPLRLGLYALAVQFSPDGRLLATGTHGQGLVQLWDIDTNRMIGLPLSNRWFIRGLAFTHDGRRLLSWCQLEARVWDVATGAPLTEPIPGNNLQNAVFNDDGTRIATCNRNDGEVLLWGGRSGELLADAMYGANFPGFFGFLDHGRFLAQTNLLGTFFVWPVPPQSQHKPAPEWLLQLATTVAGGEIDARAVFREQAVTAKTFDELRRELAALPADAPYVEWGRWFLADRATRPIGPGFKITRAELDNLAADFAAPSTPDG